MDRVKINALDPGAVPDGFYVVEVADGVVVGLTEMAAGGSLTVQDENGAVATDVTQIDFQGTWVKAEAGTGETVVTVLSPIITLAAGAPVPPGTPAGTYITRGT